jgi:ADP-dependent phosphofructokinase/glucokinase
MDHTKLKEKWTAHYEASEEQLKKMGEVKGLISAFNANIDAVIKISGKKIKEIVEKFSMDEKTIVSDGEASIQSREDALRGIVKCFKGGIAEEWLIEDVEVFNWLNDNIGYDKMQMGGQGGIVANVMAVCGVQDVYVHTASSPKEQAELFLDLDNLKNVDEHGNIDKAARVIRKKDIPLIHWIIEFDKDDTLELAGETFVCPKSNRFIATYDPLNFKLHIDEAFDKKMSEPGVNYEYIILSGYQMLKENLPDGTKGTERIDVSKKVLKRWVENTPDNILHLEIASTQDKVIRKYLIDNLAGEMDSIGFNERELIDILEVIGEDELAAQCEENTDSANLFKGMLKVYDYVGCPRMQLHMFGLYVTLQKKGFRVSPLQNRKGMQLAANVAASKAGTGSLDEKEVLLWSADQQVSDISLNELKKLADTVTELFGANNLAEEGIFEAGELEIIAVPTIIIDNPITLVGMGDTISSVSLVGAR